MSEKKKALKWLCIYIVIVLLFLAGITYLFDPFYQYHTPWFGLKQVLNDRDNQVVGTIRNNTYDSVILGSSVAENFDSEYLNTVYDCETLKIIRASGSVADLLYYMEMAHEKQELGRVFWCLDIFALTAPTEVTLYSEDTPRYLHTETILDDAPYLFNKEILFQKIPQSIVMSFMNTNTGGQAYNWAATKDFSPAGAMRAYDKPESSEIKEIPATREFAQTLKANIAMMEEEFLAHPDTEYTVMFPPYSLLWWDSGYVNGILEQYMLVLEETLPVLLSHENVEVYYFQDIQEIVCNLDHYMDMLHYSPAVNQYMLESVVAGKHKVTEENRQQVIQSMRETCRYIVEEGIYQYYD